MSDRRLLKEILINGLIVLGRSIRSSQALDRHTDADRASLAAEAPDTTPRRDAQTNEAFKVVNHPWKKQVEF